MAYRKATTKKLPDRQGEKPEEASMPPPFTHAAAEAKANNKMKCVFSSKIDGVLTAIQDIKTEIHDFAGRLSEAEHRISNTEDGVGDLQKVQTLGTQVETPSARLDDLENRHRRNNLRLVNLPEKAEGADAVKFLVEWLCEVFEDSLSGLVIIERVHRIGRLPTSEQCFPCVLIMKFLNFWDRQRVMDAAREKKNGDVPATQSDVFSGFLHGGAQTTEAV